jgi:hypothetical protein
MSKPNLKTAKIVAIILTSIILGSFIPYFVGYNAAKAEFVGVSDDMPRYLEATLPCDYLINTNTSHYFLGNGTTWKWDWIGTNFASALEFASNNASGGDIYVCKGTYEFSGNDGFDITQAGTHLHGAGYDTVFTVASGFADHVIHVTADYVKLDGFRIDGTGQSASYDGILLDGNGNGGLQAEYITVEDCGRDGIRLGDVDSTWEGNWAKLGPKLIIRNNGEYGLYLTYDATDTEIHDFLISGHSGVGDAGICVEGDNVRISTGHLWGNENEMLIAETKSVSGLLVSNVGIMDGGTQGGHRVLHSSGYNFRDSVFVGCEFWVCKLSASDTYDGIHLSGDSWNIVISSNIFRGADENDTPLEGKYAVYMDASVSNCTIVANSIRMFAQADPIYTTGAIDVTESANVISDRTS